MAKNTKAQQVSTGTPDSYTPAELADPAPPIQITRAMLGVVPEEVNKSSVGTHSSLSSESETMKDDKQNQFLPPHAPTMENLSGQPEKETDSTADLTAGGGRAQMEPPPSDDDEDDEDEESEDDVKPAKRTTSPRKATSSKTAKKAQIRSTDPDFDDF